MYKTRRDSARHQAQLFCKSHELDWDYFHILMHRISNLIHFFPQVHNNFRNSDAITSSIKSRLFMDFSSKLDQTTISNGHLAKRRKLMLWLRLIKIEMVL